MSIQIIPNVTVTSPLPWAGVKFPYHEEAADITISGATTWNDAAGFKRVGTLTIAAGQVLTIAKSPFFIFADEIVFGNTSSQINGDGPAGTTNPSAAYARGGWVAESADTINQIGGSGGILLIVCVNTISGAAGKITANGGNGTISGGSVAATADSAGQGALSGTWAKNGGTPVGGENFGEFGTILGAGGGNSSWGRGGGSGFNGGGGSGVGGGGYAFSSAVTSPTTAIISNPDIFLKLAAQGCLGGGGGGAYSEPVAGTDKLGAGGGGGGGVLVYVRNPAVTPTLQANGGTAATQATGAASNGAAGVTMLVDIK